MCARPSVEDAEGKTFSVGIQKVYVCSEHVEAFMMGTAIGQGELSQRMATRLADLDDEARGLDLKEAIYDMVPVARKQVAMKLQKFVFPSVSPREINDKLCETVVGQRLAKQQVSLAVYHHSRLVSGLIPISPISPDKQNVLLLGPSGCGKSMIVNAVAQQLKVPYITADATSHTPTGFTGSDFDSVTHDLVLKAQGLIPLAERGVVFVDEIDKLSPRGNHDSRQDSLNIATQVSLLKLIEGKRVKISPMQMGGDPAAMPIYVNTDKILWFFGGAFPGLSEHVAKKMGYSGRSVGFRGTEDLVGLEAEHRNYEVFSRATPEALEESLIEYGLTTELVGRIPTVAVLAPLSKDELLECLLKVDHSPLYRYYALFHESGYTIEYDDDFIDEVVSRAHKMASGTRALKKLVSQAVGQAAYDLLGGESDHQIGCVGITKACLASPTSYRLEEINHRVFSPQETSSEQ